MSVNTSPPFEALDVSLRRGQPPHKFRKLSHGVSLGSQPSKSKSEVSSNSSEDDESEDYEDFQHHAAMNLLGIRRWDAQSQLAGSPSGTEKTNQESVSRSVPMHADASPSLDGKGELSITQVYEPKFFKVFRSYCEAMQQEADLSKHMMSICLEHLISFSSWARENGARCQWIRRSLDDNPDLRPEVRNGLSMILIYCVSAAQAKQRKDFDMFAVLQEPDTGLGIVNKTSLKIYNDPFNYFAFLKSCMSGLIDAGKIPENERQNQPKKAKRQAVNLEEISAFIQLKNILVSLLNRGDNPSARIIVQQVLDVWQNRQKNVRNKRFQIAVSTVSSSLASQSGASSSIASASMNVPLFSSSATLLDIGKEASVQDDLTLKNLNPSSDGPIIAFSSRPVVSENILPSSSSVVNPSSVVGLTTFISGLNQVPPQEKRPVQHPRHQLSTSIPAYRFERVGGKEWDYKENKIFNVENLVTNVSSSFFLLDESKLSEEERRNKRIVSQAGGFVSLQTELQQRGALLTLWPKTDHCHMVDFLTIWMNREQECSLIDCWKKCAVGSDALTQSAEAVGAIAYEVVMQVGIVLRKNDQLGIKEDCWRLIYPLDLQSEMTSSSFGVFLGSFFPQLRAALSRLTAEDFQNVVVKYFPHKIEDSFLQPPRSDSSIAYQTISTLDENASNVISRFEANIVFHDICLEVL